VTQPAPELEPCPFCGGENVTTYLDSEQGDKWGYAGCDRCDARGPEVRTNYEREHDAPWHSEAILKWNTRADATQTAVAAALKMAAQTARLTMTIQKGADELTCTLCAEEVRKLISLPAEAALEAYVAERVAEALAEQTAGPLSAKVENLERSIRFALAAGMTELNLGNYDHDQVCDLQNEAIEIHSILTAALERNAATPTPADAEAQPFVKVERDHFPDGWRLEWTRHLSEGTSGEWSAELFLGDVKMAVSPRASHHAQPREWRYPTDPQVRAHIEKVVAERQAKVREAREALIAAGVELPNAKPKAKRRPWRALWANLTR
jgi:Lar family restriction alleviation protein